MRQSLGTVVFSGMLGVTGFGLLFMPAFYTLMQRTGGIRGRAATNPGGPRRPSQQRPHANAIT